MLSLRLEPRLCLLQVVPACSRMGKRSFGNLGWTWLFDVLHGAPLRSKYHKYPFFTCKL